VKQELFAHFVLISWTRQFTNWHDEPPPATVEETPSEPPMQLNFKHAMTVLGEHLNQLILASREQLATSLQCIFQRLLQCRQRLRPGRKFPRESKQPQNKWSFTPISTVPT